MKNVISIGIEQEFFVQKQGKVPSRKAIDDLLNHLQEVTNGKLHNQGQNCASQLHIDTDFGLLHVKTDGYTHVLEVAYPPFFDPNDFQQLYQYVWHILQPVMAQYEFTIIPGGYCSVATEKVITYPSSPSSLLRQQLLNNRPLPNHKLASTALSSLMCATHIHLGVNIADRFRWLPALYSFEYLIPWLFSNSTTSNEHCIRPLIYRDSFGADYPAAGFPDSIPNTEEAYGQMLNSCRPFIRDYSFIAPHALGTLEFRTACAQPSLSALWQLIALRLLIWEAVQQGFISFVADSRTHFYAVCESGIYAMDKHASEDLRMLLTLMDELPYTILCHLRPVLTSALHTINQNTYNHYMFV